MKLLAFSRTFNRPVIQTGSLTALDRIIRDCEYLSGELILVQCFDNLDAWHWTPEQIKAGSDLFVVNRAMGVLT